MKQMSEREAWVYLAPLWDKPTMAGGVAYAIIYFGDRAEGLCGSVFLLWYHGLISNRTRNAMGKQIKAVPKTIPGLHAPDLYAWPRNLAGAKQRAAFCRRMARKPKKTKGVR